MASPPSVSPKMLTTQQAADLLNVSRAYVTRLVDAGKFVGVQRTGSGRHRIPVAEVERLRAQMQRSRRRALDRMKVLTSDLPELELSEAKGAKSQ